MVGYADKRHDRGIVSNNTLYAKQFSAQPERKVTMTDHYRKLQLSLLLLRLTVFLLMFMWTIDKFVNPEHASNVYENFYRIAGPESVVMYAIGAIEIVILLLFLVGYQKKYTYGAVLAFHNGLALK